MQLNINGPKYKSNNVQNDKNKGDKMQKYKIKGQNTKVTNYKSYKYK